MPTALEVSELDVSSWALDISTAILDTIVEGVPSVSHHTGAVRGDAGIESDLVLHSNERMVIPGFDMKYEKEPVGPGGAMRGGLLTGNAVRRNKQGEPYTVVPINAEHSPSGYNRLTDVEQETYLVANKLAEKSGPDVAFKYLVGALGGNVPMAYQWVNGRYKGAVGEPGSRTVFRTVKDTEEQENAWWYPPSIVMSPVAIGKVFAEIESLFGGSG